MNVLQLFQFFPFQEHFPFSLDSGESILHSESEFKTQGSTCINESKRVKRIVLHVKDNNNAIL